MWTSSALRLTATQYRSILLTARRSVYKPPPRQGFGDLDNFNLLEFLKRFGNGCLEISGLKKVPPMERETLKKKRFATMCLMLMVFVAVWEELVKFGSWQ